METYLNQIPIYYVRRESEIQRQRNDELISKFLGNGPRAVEAYTTPAYFGELLAWALKQVTSSPGWETISVHAYRFEEPVFSDISTAYESHESCLISGLMLVKKEDVLIVISCAAVVGYIQIQASGESHEVVKKLVQEIRDYLKEHNFYKGRKIKFNGKISFLDVEHRDWNSVILDPDMKNSIRLNTIGFLKNIARMPEFGIPQNVELSWPVLRGLARPLSAKPSCQKPRISHVLPLTLTASQMKDISPTFTS